MFIYIRLRELARGGEITLKPHGIGREWVHDRIGGRFRLHFVEPIPRYLWHRRPGGETTGFDASATVWLRPKASLCHRMAA